MATDFRCKSQFHNYNKLKIKTFPSSYLCERIFIAVTALLTKKRKQCKLPNTEISKNFLKFINTIR